MVNIEKIKGKKGITYRCRKQVNGRRVTKTFKTLKEAKEFIKNTSYELQHNIYKEVCKLTLNQWFDIYIEEYKKDKIKESTIRFYKQIYKNHIKEVFGDCLLINIDTDSVQKFFNNKAKENLTQGTLLKIKTFFYNILEIAKRTEKLEKNVCGNVILPKVNKKDYEKYVLTRDEQEIFLNHIRKNKNVFNLIFEVALFTGLRTGELLGLRWQDIDFTNRVIHIRKNLIYISKDEYYLSTPKTKTSIRDVPILENVFEILKIQKKEQNMKKIQNCCRNKDNLVFFSSELHTFNNVLNYHLKKTLEELNIQNTTMHNLRRTFATRCIESGMQPNTLKNILGHSNLSMTMDIYVQTKEEQKTKEIQLLKNII